jgi:hypothetical protein
MTIRHISKAQDSCADLTTQVSLFAALIREAPRDKLQLSGTAEWGPREMLIHLAFWHQQYVSIIKSLLKHKQPVLLRGSFKSINAMSVEEFRNCSAEELVVSLEKSQRELVFLAQVPETNSLRFSFRHGSKIWEFPQFTRAISQHIRNHRLQAARRIRS